MVAMKAGKQGINVKAIAAAWRTLVDNVGEISTIRSPEENERAAQLLDVLLEITHADRHHALAGLIDLVSGLVEAYESRRFGDPDSSPADVLRLLMEANNLKQTDLAGEVGGQPVVSAILNGRRQINARQAAALGARFGVSPALFIERRRDAHVAQADLELQARFTAERERLVALTAAHPFEDVNFQRIAFAGRGLQSTDIALDIGGKSLVPERAYQRAAQRPKSRKAMTMKFIEGSTYGHAN